MNNLDAIAEAIRAEWEQMDEQRDAALKKSRDLIRHCADMIRAVHRHQWEAVAERLAATRAAAADLRQAVAGYPALEYAGYTQDAFREYVEAVITYALVRGDDQLPTPEALGVLPDTYLNGLAEAASELRRHILDLLREAHNQEVERLLAAMDTSYTVLFSFDFPDAVTDARRRDAQPASGPPDRSPAPGRAAPGSGGVAWPAQRRDGVQNSWVHRARF